MDFDPDMENFSKELQNMVAKREGDILKSMAEIETNCFNVGKDDVDRFVKCMTPAVKKLEKEERKLEFKLTFFQAKTIECFKKNKGNPDEIKKCKDNAINNIESHLNDFLKNIK